METGFSTAEHRSLGHDQHMVGRGRILALVTGGVAIAVIALGAIAAHAQTARNERRFATFARVSLGYHYADRAPAALRRDSAWVRAHPEQVRAEAGRACAWLDA